MNRPELKHMALSVPCEPINGSPCKGTRILSTWLNAEYKYFFITTCTACDAPAPNEPFADETPDEWRF
jgi:hypothetical protein